MQIDELTSLESRMQGWLADEFEKNGDSGHDLAHVQRVVSSAKKIGIQEGADPEIVLPAAWLHDCVIVSKKDPRRDQASRLAAERAREWLAGEEFTDKQLQEIAHAIEAHSFSARITPETVEARVVQDADRLDAIGAIGIARCFAIGGMMGAALYHPGEIFPENRPADDKAYIVDHFFEKLMKLEGQMQTEAGRNEARSRTEFMHRYLEKLRNESGI